MRPPKTQLYILVLLNCFLFFGQERLRDSLLGELEKARAKKTFSETDTNYIDLLNNIAKKYRHTATDSLFYYAGAALRLSQKKAYITGSIDAMKNMGIYHYGQGDIDEAESVFSGAIELAMNNHFPKKQAGILNEMTIMYFYQRNYPKALRSCLEGIELAEKHEMHILLTGLYSNLANMYLAQEQYDEALKHYKKVVAISHTENKPVYVAEAYSAIAIIAYKTGDFDNAIDHINECISIFEEHQILDWLAYSSGIKADIHLEMGNPIIAQYWYEKSGELCEKLDFARGTIEYKIGLAKTYHELKQSETAKIHGQEAYELSTSLNAPDLTKESAEILFKIYDHTNDVSKALKYNKIFKKASDSINSNKNKNSLILLMAQSAYKLEKQELIFENEKKLARSRLIVFFVTTVLLVTAIFTVYTLKAKKRYKRMSHHLREKTKKLKTREKQLSKSNMTKDTIFSIIGHDLRQPINGLQNILKLFNTGSLSKEEFLSVIPTLTTNVNHVFFTLNNLLNWGQSQTGIITTKPTIVDLNKLVNNTIELLNVVAKEKSITVLNTIQGEPKLKADEDHIDIVIRNLINNAIKFTPENGLITINAEDENGYWKLVVRDTGIGMDKETCQKIFNDNTAITTHGTNDEKGTGLGLRLCRELVLKNNGKIWAESAPKKGTSIFVALHKTTQKPAA